MGGIEYLENTKRVDIPYSTLHNSFPVHVVYDGVTLSVCAFS